MGYNRVGRVAVTRYPSIQAGSTKFIMVIIFYLLFYLGVRWCRSQYITVPSAILIIVKKRHQQEHLVQYILHIQDHQSQESPQRMYSCVRSGVLNSTSK